MEKKIVDFHTNFYIPAIQKLAFHLAYLVQITVVKWYAQPSNGVDYLKMFYVVVIVLRGLLQALLIKYNHNTMVEIYPYL